MSVETARSLPDALSLQAAQTPGRFDGSSCAEQTVHAPWDYYQRVEIHTCTVGGSSKPANISSMYAMLAGNQRAEWPRTGLSSTLKDFKACVRSRLDTTVCELLQGPQKGSLKGLHGGRGDASNARAAHLT